MAVDLPPTAFARLLGIRMTQCRIQKGHSATLVARETGISASAICRLETGQRRTSREVIAHLLGYYGATGQERDRILQYHSAAYQRSWLAYESVGCREQEMVLSYCESVARIGTTYDPTFVPKRLRTSEYAVEIGQPNFDIPACNSVRMTSMDDRQPRLIGLVAESALRCSTIDSGIMHGQLLHLAAFRQTKHVGIRVVPTGQHDTGPIEPFTVMDCRDKSAVAHIRTCNASIIIDEIAVVEDYFSRAGEIMAVSLNEASSYELINELAIDLFMPETREQDVAV